MRLHKRTKNSYSRLCVILMSDRVEAFVSLTDATGTPHIVFETAAPLRLSIPPSPLNVADSTNVVAEANSAIEATGANEANEARFLRPPLLSLTTALATACKDLATEALPHIVSKSITKGHFDAITIFYGAPWYLSRGRRVVIERTESSPLTEKALHGLIEENIKGILPSDMRDIVILEERARSFTVNGYPVESPIGTTGREVGMHLFVSAVDLATKNAVENTLHRYFHAHTVEHHSTLFSLVQAFAQLKKNDDPYLLVDISGHVTEVSRVERGMVLDTVSFPEGFETITMRIAEDIKRRPEEVRTALARPNDFALARELDTARDATLGRWGEGYAHALGILDGGGLRLATILIADTPLQASFKREIVQASGASVFPVSKDAYLSFYESSARPYAHTLSALLSLG